MSTSRVQCLLGMSCEPIGGQPPSTPKQKLRRPELPAVAAVDRPSRSNEAPRSHWHCHAASQLERRPVAHERGERHIAAQQQTDGAITDHACLPFVRAHHPPSCGNPANDSRIRVRRLKEVEEAFDVE